MQFPWNIQFLSRIFFFFACIYHLCCPPTTFLWFPPFPLPFGWRSFVFYFSFSWAVILMHLFYCVLHNLWLDTLNFPWQQYWIYNKIWDHNNLYLCVRWRFILKNLFIYCMQVCVSVYIYVHIYIYRKKFKWEPSIYENLENQSAWRISATFLLKGCYFWAKKCYFSLKKKRWYF